MITAIVLLSVNDFSDGRKIAERLEGQTFKTPDAVSANQRYRTL